MNIQFTEVADSQTENIVLGNESSGVTTILLQLSNALLNDCTPVTLVITYNTSE